MFGLHRVSLSVLLVGAAILGCAVQPSGEAASAEKAPQPASRLPVRRSKWVKLVERCSPAVVNVMSYTRMGQGPNYILNAGTGTIVHEAGYILTNSHVAGGDERKIHLHNGKVYDYRVVARLAPNDLALVKIDAAEPLTAIQLGRSHDLMLGESVFVIGNAARLPQTVSIGIVSGINRAAVSPSGLITGMVQTNAAINNGNSGGPLMNTLGELIGVIESQTPGKENVAYAVSMENVRRVFPEMLLAEKRGGFRLGLEVDAFGPAKVTKVVARSPAAKAGVRVGDVVRRAGKMRVDDGLHFHMALLERKVGEVLPLDILRDGKSLSVSPKLEEIPLRRAVSSAGLVKGLKLEIYAGAWQKLPDFDKLKAVGGGRIYSFTHAVHPQVKDNFAARFSGYVYVHKDGLYIFHAASDDGSRLYIGDELVIDNDGLHGAFERSGSIRLQAGVHPITVTFFEAAGAELLKVFYEGPDLNKQEVPATVLFSKP